MAGLKLHDAAAIGMGAVVRLCFLAACFGAGGRVAVQRHSPLLPIHNGQLAAAPAQFYVRVALRVAALGAPFIEVN